MPVLTFDLTIGTKRVKYLNLSHNSINTIRKGVIGNLTSLLSLDLSHNCLEDLIHEPRTFDLPANLTHLYLNANQLSQIPTKSIENAKELKLVDMQRNEITTIDWAIVEKIKQRTDFNFDDNRLHCDCRLRPLNHYFTQFVELPDMYRGVTCDTPDFLRDQKLYEIADDYLNCIDDSGQLREASNISAAFDFDVLPDIRFRQVS